jgi:DNA-binding NarL/FixJ family response regulator
MAALPQPETSEAGNSAPGCAKPTVFILSDVRLYRDGLSRNLIRDGSLAVVGAAEASDATIASLKALELDAIILDFTIARSLEFAYALRVNLPRTKLVAFAVGNVDCALLAGAAAGISGYVHRDGSTDDLVKEVQHAVRGELHCSPRNAALLLEKIASLCCAGAYQTRDSSADQMKSLTQREAEILNHVEKGLSNKEIARSLNISCATVKNHVHHILEKLNVSRRSQVLARVRERRIETMTNIF